uniref:SAM domain-containing protein n=1 Tax=Caenorhabditis japonica TaxID=281687 RepID=A0A8R1I1X0_CAEJA
MLDVKPLPSDPNLWRCEDVSTWLKKIGMTKYADLIAFKHKVDGKCLLALTDTDLKEPPVSINCLGDIKKILFAIEKLNPKVIELCSPNNSNPQRYTNGKAYGKDNLLVEFNEQSLMSISGEDIVTTTRRAEIIEDEDSLLNTLSRSTDGTSTVQLISREEIIRQVERPDTYFKSLAKLAIAFTYSSLSFLVTSFVMVLVHDRVPDTKMYPPLPDIVLDNVPHIPWAFDMCETIGVVLAIVWFTVLLFHKERVIIARRMFSLLGTVFLLRCFTMLITSLSVPGIHLQCEAR